MAPIEYSQLYELMQRLEGKVDKLDEQISLLQENYHALNLRIELLQQNGIPARVQKLEDRVEQLLSQSIVDKKDIEASTKNWSTLISLVLNGVFKLVVSVGIAVILYKLGLE